MRLTHLLDDGLPEIKIEPGKVVGPFSFPSNSDSVRREAVVELFSPRAVSARAWSRYKDILINANHPRGRQIEASMLAVNLSYIHTYQFFPSSLGIPEQKFSFPSPSMHVFFMCSPSSLVFWLHTEAEQLSCSHRCFPRDSINFQHTSGIYYSSLHLRARRSSNIWYDVWRLYALVSGGTVWPHVSYPICLLSVPGNY